MQGSQTFDTLYKQLNPEQKKAVDTVEGPVMVIAGPGTGKTQILTVRIANILRQTDVSPENILALTFTESGAYSMRKRLVNIIGSAAYKVHIHTFHSFCNEVIKAYPESFPRVIGGSNVSDIDQIGILEEIIGVEELEHLKPYGNIFHYLQPVLGSIRNLKRERISVDAFEKIIEKQRKEFEDADDKIYEKGAYKGKIKGTYKDLEKSINKNEELLLLYTAYQEALTEKHLYDYEDMILEVILALEKDEDLRLRLQEKHQYILADEHQDANSAQNALLELLTSFHDNPNLFIVGDEKQAIFRFQGASLDNFLYFKEKFPSANLITLEYNYRSTQTILDASHSLIEHNDVADPALRKKLQSQKGADERQMVLFEFARTEDEHHFVARSIKERLEAGANPREIAILYRDNRDVLAIAKELEREQVPFIIESNQDVLADDDMRKLLLLLGAVIHAGDEHVLAQALYLDVLGLEQIDVHKVLTYRAKEKKQLHDVLKSKTHLEKAGVERVEQVREVHKNIAKWGSISRNVNLVDAFEGLVNESGFIAYLLGKEHAVEAMGKLNVFFDEVKKLAQNHRDARLSDFLNYIETLERYNVLIKVRATGQFEHGVRLMTAHKAKGLEFAYVYVIGVYDGHWGNRRSMRHFHIPVKGLQALNVDGDEDERRLFYVALTRAEQDVVITYAREGLDGRQQLVSRFIEEIDAAFLQPGDASTHERDAEALGEQFATPAYSGIRVEDKIYLNTLFLDQGLSVTAVNNFIDCPWNYFFNNLLRIPRLQNKHLMYGTAVHATLKHFFDKYRDEEDMSKSELLKLFEQYLTKQPLSDEDYAPTLKKGKKALGGYYDTYNGSWGRSLLTEYNIAGVFVDVPVDGEMVQVLLRGVLDKIEFLSDGPEINVVDFKTGKPRSRNDIEGKTKISTGAYKRQLVFYKLLLDQYEKGKRVALSGTIDFIEPNAKGAYKKEDFEITKEDVTELEELIKDVSAQILSLSFWEIRCGKKDCEYCMLRDMMKEDNSS